MVDLLVGSMPTPLESGPLVLIAEDDDEMRRLLARAMRRDGYDVVAEADGDLLLSAARAALADGRRPALLVSDVRMPRVGGMELVTRVVAEMPWVRTILITAFADEDVTEAAHAMGVLRVMSKPFDLYDLRTAAMLLLSA